MPDYGQPVPAIRGKFGTKLWCYQTTIPAIDFRTVIGHDPRSRQWGNLKTFDHDTFELYEYIQRKTEKSRADGLKEYILNRLRGDRSPYLLGAFPAISIGLTEEATFDPYDQSGRDVDSDIGVLRLPSCPRVILDGLGRITATLDLIYGASKDDSGRKEIGSWFTFPVTFYVPSKGSLTREELGQLFFDFNYKQKTVSNVKALQLDQSDPYIQMCNHLANAEVIKRHGGVEHRGSLGNKSTGLVVQKHLFKFVRGAIEGRQAQDQDKHLVENPRLTSETFDNWLTELTSFLEEIERLMTPERFGDRRSLHLTSWGWQLMGLLFHDVHVTLADRMTATERESVLRRFADLDWSRSCRTWIDILGKEERDPETDQIVLGKVTNWGREVKSQMLAYVREQCALAGYIRVPESEDRDSPARDVSLQPMEVA